MFLGDGVQFLQAAMAVVLGARAAVEGEHGGDASQRGQVDDQDGLGNGHVHGRRGGRNVECGCQHFLQYRTEVN